MAASSWLEVETASRMAVSPLDSERACLSGPAEEDIWVRLTPSSPATFSQAVVLEVKHYPSQPTSTRGGKEANASEDGGERTSPRGGPPHEGSVQVEDPPASSRSTEEGLNHGWISERGDREAGKPRGCHEDSSAFYCPEPACLPSATKAKAFGASLTPTSAKEEASAMGARAELPLQETVVAMEHVSLSKDRLPDNGEQESAEKPCCILAEEASGDEQECPICTEPYDPNLRKPALLNCGHVLCGRCLHTIMEVATTADIGRVRCPICRQKTPMMEWEICKLQEELLLLHSEPSPVLTPPALDVLPVRRSGLWGSLEHHFQVRFHTTRMIGFLPCFHYPPCLISGLARLERRCRWCYRLALVALLVAEMLSLMLVFLPIVLLLLLFLILDR